MQLSFRTLSLLTALLCFILAIAWGSESQRLLELWELDFSSSTGFVARRSAMMFLGLGVMFYCARNAPASPTRNALCMGFMTGCFGLALLGTWEWIEGHAGPGILLAVAVEAALGLGFWRTRRAQAEWINFRD